MKLQKEFKQNILEYYLTLHWKQWHLLGFQTNIKKTDFTIDLEALIISTFFAGHFDKRLIYSMIEWIEINREWISLSRIKNILKFYTREVKNESVSYPSKLIIEILSQKKSDIKNLKFKDNEYSEIFKDYKKRGVVQKISFDNEQLIQLFLRTIFGVNSRVEIFLFLMSGKSENANYISKEIFYDQKIVFRVLKNWELSGLVKMENNGKEKLYSLNKSFGLVRNKIHKSPFLNWPGIFLSFGKIISILKNNDLSDDIYLVSSQLRNIYQDILKLSNIAGVDLKHELNFQGEDLFFYLQDKLIKIFKSF